MDYISTKAAAERWHISERRVQIYCRQGRIPGVQRFGKSWQIPSDVEKPEKLQRGTPAGAQPVCELPYGFSMFILSPFYGAPGSAEALGETLKSEESRALWACQLAFYQWRLMDAATGIASLERRALCFESRVACCNMRALIALYSGDAAQWMQAQKALQKLALHRKGDETLTLTKTILSLAINAGRAPKWLCEGDFEAFSPGAYAVALYAYTLWLKSARQYDALGAVIGSAVAFAKNNGLVLLEIYFRLYAAEYRQVTGNAAAAVAQIDQAIALAMPDRLYTPLIENRWALSSLLDKRLQALAPDGYAQISRDFEGFKVGYAKIYNLINGAQLSDELTLREHEAARLAIQGLCNGEIARQMGISAQTVKKLLSSVFDKTGAGKRTQLKKYVK